MTTETLMEKIKQNYPGVEIDPKMLNEALLNNGYKLYLLHGIGQRWLMKPKAWPKILVTGEV